jgi:ABC-2 type transport system ATP-binding protein
MREVKAVEIKNLVKKYGNFTAVNNISLTAEIGEIYAILGPNGAGKTSTIKMILGILHRTKGDIKVLGEKIGNVKNKISFVPEEKNFYDNLTPEKAVKMCERLLDFDSEKMNKYIERFRLPPKKISTFSHGMKTLLYLSISFSENAQLYIFDEPTWGLDPIMRDEVLDEIRNLALEGKSVFYTSHILPEVEKVVDKIAIMNKGNILFEGYLDDAKENFKRVVLPKDAKTGGYHPIYKKIEDDSLILYMYDKDEIEDIKSKYQDLDISTMNLENIFQAIVRGDNHAL